MVQANTCDLFSNTYLNYYNNNYSCSLPTSQWSGQQITSCTFTFNSCNVYGQLYCNLSGNNSYLNCGSYNSYTHTWSCTLDNNQLCYLNDCLSNGKCDFNLNCYGYSYIGKCSWTYTCTPKTPHVVPDTVTTAFLLGVGLLCVEGLRRRQLVPAKAK